MNQQQRDIEEERKQATFDVRKLVHILNGGEHNTKSIEKVKKMIEADPVFSFADRYFLTKEERYTQGLQKFSHFRELLATHQLDSLTPFERSLFENNSCRYHAMSLHSTMFLPTLRSQLDEEQTKYWLPKAENYDIVGCYAQTELGHGSNVRGLETISVFDIENDHFIIHSPTITSSKWWPGSLGKTATHAIVHARLLLPKDKYIKVSNMDFNNLDETLFEDKGIHGFIVQLRCLQTHQHMEGVKSGEIGPKYGTNENDNGFLRLTKVKVPRNQMLSKFQKVEKDGTYHVKNQKNSKLSYGTMLYIRAGIVEGAGKSLAMASTISIRYSSIRRQFSADEDEEKGSRPLELKVLDYQSQQYRILPHLATSYGLLATGQYMRSLYMKLQQGIKSGDLDSLPEVHATSSGLKAITTILASEGIEECRKYYLFIYL